MAIGELGDVEDWEVFAPNAVRVMADYQASPIWPGSAQTRDSVTLSESLSTRLRDWGDEYTDKNLGGMWEPGEQVAWVERGRVLATEVRREIPSPAIRVYYLVYAPDEDGESEWVELVEIA